MFKKMILSESILISVIDIPNEFTTLGHFGECVEWLGMHCFRLGVGGEMQNVFHLERILSFPSSDGFECIYTTNRLQFIT